ncbi:bi-domain-containing oxidoreductase [Portibacter marinus]|uniref:bi-domain-containing oxidoreductase n=1 Tax=Portibacter marinus TaxID=2898660 RepID=UPI001F1E535D|nr:bi-domain-containing oxidoreductase [Portibacter marinus]
MKQIIQDLKTGKTILEDVPVPSIKEGHVLIKTHRSLVSLGTEKMLVEFGKANYIQKARQQPEKVKQVIQKIKTDGLKPTLDAVFRKLGEPLPLGYCNAGQVIGIGKGVKGIQLGDRVVSNGHHAEVVCIPENLIAKIPDNVSYEEAAFTVIGAIALQGIRLIAPSFGETVVVTGLGLIGLIASQILKANGCQVIGLDFDTKKIELAKSWGIAAYNASTINVVDSVLARTGNIGADAVLITASSKSNDIISQAAQMSRQRGRIVLVGVIGLNMNRADMYEKELTFQVSCSYGPGRYDYNYENKGLDYPIGFVRWTEKRNFEAVLKAISEKSINTLPLITDKVPLLEYHRIYGEMSSTKSIASILEYTDSVDTEISTVKVKDNPFNPSKGIVGIIGAGNFTASMIAPVLSKLGVQMKYIVSSKGLSGTVLAKKYQINYSSTEYRDVLDDPACNAVIITTRHGMHAEMVIKALQKDKHVFVEKPLALTFEEINQIEEAYKNANSSLTVGFNRRFSPFIQSAKTQLGSAAKPINVIATMNAGAIPQDHWVHDLNEGGGRIIGEACHYIDLITFLTGSLVDEVVMNAQGKKPGAQTDNASILLRYANGSQGVIHYFSDGNKSYSKERIEIYDQGKNIIIDNFRSIKYYGYRSRNRKKSQDKGHFEQFRRWSEMIQSGDQHLIPFHEIINTSKASIACVKSLQEKVWIQI